MVVCWGSGVEREAGALLGCEGEREGERGGRLDGSWRREDLQGVGLCFMMIKPGFCTYICVGVVDLPWQRRVAS